MWTPSPERVERANITRYLHWLRDRRGLRFASYDELWRWSVDDLDGFWTSVWEFFEVGGPAPGPALAERRMPGARRFPRAILHAPEFGVTSVVARFAQIEPKVRVGVDGSRYNGAWHDRRDALAEIRRRLPTLEATVLVGGSGGPVTDDHPPVSMDWGRLLEDGAGV